jgi:hypothetical protein
MSVFGGIVTWRLYSLGRQLKSESKPPKVLEYVQQDIPIKTEVIGDAQPSGNWRPEQIEVLAKSSDEYPVNFDDAWQWIGYATKGSAKRVLEANFKTELDYRVVFNSPVKNSLGRPSESIHLTTACFKKFCMMAGRASIWGFPISKRKNSNSDRVGVLSSADFKSEE